jgi:hypothetical protein
LSDEPGSSGTVTFIQTAMTDTTAPALSAAEWSGVLGQQDGLKHLREQFGTLPFSTHAIAALLLYEQPFGFTQQDVTDEEEVSEYCAVMAAQNRLSGDLTTAAKFELLGGRHEGRAARIAALLPPVRAAQG